MITELFDGITDILSIDYSFSDNWCQVGYMSTYFEKTFGFRENLVRRRRDIIIPGSPKIILVLSKNPTKSTTSRYYDYVMVGGVPSIVIMINQHSLEDGNTYDQIHCITHTAWHCCRAANSYTVEHIKSETHYNIIDAIWYAPALLTISVIDELYKEYKIDDQIIAASLNVFYKNYTISAETVASIRNAIKIEGGLRALIDNNLFGAIDDVKYPGARFADMPIEGQQENDSDDDPVADEGAL